MFRFISQSLLPVAMAITLAGCSAMTTIQSAQTDVVLKVKEREYKTYPAGDTFKTTTFGNYDFRAERPGAEPLYGILPLKFNGGYLTLDILFFAPGTFFNLREVFPFYEIDMIERAVRYRKGADKPWEVYRPTTEESKRAEEYFQGQK